MINNYTKEPWTLRTDPEDLEWLIHGGDGWICRVMLRGEGRDSEKSANARRIVECVNACMGIDNPLIEIKKYKDTIALLEEKVRFYEKQRQEIVERISRIRKLQSRIEK